MRWPQTAHAWGHPEAQGAPDFRVAAESKGARSYFSVRPPNRLSAGTELGACREAGGRLRNRTSSGDLHIDYA